METDIICEKQQIRHAKFGDIDDVMVAAAEAEWYCWNLQMAEHYTQTMYLDKRWTEQKIGTKIYIYICISIYLI